METRSGLPVNTKSLCAFLTNEMLRLKEHETTVEEALAQAALASQVNKLFDYELKRTMVQVKLNELGQRVEPKIREIESKAFE